MKTAGGKKVHISGLTSGAGADTRSSDLPPLMEFSSDDNHRMATTGPEVSNDTCFSNNPMENKSQEKVLEEFTSSSSRNYDFSPFPFAFPEVSPLNCSPFLTQINTRAETLTGRDSAMMQDESVMRLFFDNNGMETKTEPEQGMPEAGFKAYQDQDIPVISTTGIDLDCLWDY